MTDSLLRRAQHTLTPAQRRDLPSLIALTERDPVTHVVARMHLDAAQASGVVPGGLWAVRRRAGLGREVCGLVWAGANLTATLAPTQDDDADDDLRADVAAAMVGRLSRPAAIVGDAGLTLDLWGRVEPWWGPAREVREHQVSMTLDHAAAMAPMHEVDDLSLEGVRLATLDDYDLLLPACVHMFIGEVGYDPMRHGRAAYEERLRYLIRAGRAYVRMGIVDGRRQVVFKAEVGALGGSVAQAPGGVGASRRARSGHRARGPCAGGRRDQGHHRAHRVAVRQRLQRRRDRGLPCRRLSRGRRLRHRDVLTASTPAPHQ
ncbi:hypothetical protein GCM10025876_32570 [Demequina litorisediminis]|uniref:DUF4081 domain-containing protein n=1 Tax=Demequina litorisediminis TaxID=1849022 RepID=A0ABQ6IK11_9MICO|nr:DUF4081 domain-containing protein [Demequina litorisediminis]GMA37053.1 hypothetical protein GCM10025876_32570 [Demequina litorisediminis]